MIVASQRTTEEVHQRLLDSARTLFGLKGFAGASVREIARHAETSPVLLFRHFGTKAGLFQEAIVDPTARVIADYLTQWEEQQEISRQDEEESWPDPLERLIRVWVEGLFDVLSEHREQVRALLITNAHEVRATDGTSGLDSPVSQILDRLQELGKNEISARGYTGIDASIAVCLAFSLVLGVAVLDEVAFSSPLPNREAVLDEIVTLVISGTTRP